MEADRGVAAAFTILFRLLGMTIGISSLTAIGVHRLQTLTGPIVGASVFAVLQDTVMRSTEYWRALLGGVILLLVLAFPMGLAGWVRQRYERWAVR